MASAEFGFVISAVGDFYIREALLAIRCLRRHHSESIYLFTDDSLIPLDLISRLQTFDVKLVQLNASVSELFFLSLVNSPFQVTISLETDCFVSGSLSDLFTLSQSYDLAFTLNPQRVNPAAESSIPFSFPLPDTGVLLLKKTPSTTSYFAELARQAVSSSAGQTPADLLRTSLWSNPIRYCVFPDEYCARSINIYKSGIEYSSTLSPILCPQVHHMRIPGLKGMQGISDLPINEHLHNCGEISMMNIIRNYLISN